MKWDLLGNLNLLIVDDDPFNRQLVITLLSKIENIHFKEAENGIKALEILKETSIDMVLLDLHMPILDGYETLKVIKQEPKYEFIPVAIVTTDEQEMNQLYSLGADDFISKPFKLSELESRIYAHIEKRQYRQKYKELSQKKIQNTLIESKKNKKEKPKEETQASYSLDFIEQHQKSFFCSMAKIVSKKNKNLQDIQVVALLSKALSLLIGCDKEKASTIYSATLIREIGQISLDKQTPLSYQLSHETTGQHEASILAAYELLNSMIETNFIKIAKNIILQSKEHFDGSGFPKQRKKSEIHNIAYIVSLVEAFNALLAQKTYLNDKIHTAEETYSILEAASGQRFHPQITKIFLDHFEYFIGLREKIIKQNQQKESEKI